MKTLKLEIQGSVLENGKLLTMREATKAARRHLGQCEILGSARVTAVEFKDGRIAWDASKY